MSRLESRIKRLEIQVLGDEDRIGFTWEEFLHLWRFLGPRRVSSGAADEESSSGRMPPIVETPFPWNIKQLARRWERFQEAYRARMPSDAPTHTLASRQRTRNARVKPGFPAHRPGDPP